MSVDHQVWAAKSIKQHLWGGSICILALAGGAIGWSSVAQLASAVVAPGSVAVLGHVKTVKHLSGGVVGELLVTEGQQVHEGQILIRLDATLNRTNLAIVSKALEQSWAREARLEAERDGLSSFEVPWILQQREGKTIEAAVLSERRLFTENRRLREGQEKQLNERISQLREKIKGHALQQRTKGAEIKLVEQELKAVTTLYEKGMMTLDRMNALARSHARLQGEQGQLVAAVAETKSKIAETEIELLLVAQTFLSNVVVELRDLQVRVGELREREIAAAAQLAASEIRAPLAGRVHQLSIHTEGGVISPAERLMDIVPLSDEFIVEATVAPQDIDQLAVGQPAILRLTAFNLNTTPELLGEVLRISPDLVSSPENVLGYYRVGIAIPPSELAKLEELKLVPGMPVESLIKTGNRTVLSYLIKPIMDHSQRAFKEE
ncbi:HlyD family type I secretion periplasmic adaptor subunit [Pseudomonas sp. W2-17]|uniref:HlyD family type I secretion periplasmic adaptor subunit n=1 Tax=Pseudomonas sp. W2-17 TaxID=3058039 RepID=UPI0034E08465